MNSPSAKKLSMKCYMVPVTPFAQNSSVLICESSRKAAIVDPGGDLEKLMQVIEEEDVEVEKIFLTHGHMDHVAGTEELGRRLSVSVEGPHTGDLNLIEKLPESCARSGFPPAKTFVPNRWLENDDRVEFGDQSLLVKHCPGHTPGHVIFFHEATHLAIVGDVLFQGSVGRTDLPGGNHQQLINSIVNRLWPLGSDVTFVPGHGPASTFSRERQTNPFVADSILQRES